MGSARCTEVVGRDAERALLDARLRGVAEGSCATVVLLGGAGIAKPALSRGNLLRQHFGFVPDPTPGENYDVRGQRDEAFGAPH